MTQTTTPIMTLNIPGFFKASLIDIFPDASYINFLGDDFLRLMLCRYIFCDALLRIHRSFRVSSIALQCHCAALICKYCFYSHLNIFPSLTRLCQSSTLLKIQLYK